MKYIIGTGWWCTEKYDEDERKIKYGDDAIRGKDFSLLWKKSIDKFTSSKRIVVVDSNSPVSNDLLLNDDSVEYIKLQENGGHATNINGRFCGWSRGVLQSMQYALFSGADYYVYVEQDVLLSGENIIGYCISKMKKPFMFGESLDYPQPLQQSFFIIKKEKIAEFISNYMAIPYGDNIISCEIKFAVSTSKFFKLIPLFLFVKPKSNNMLSKVVRNLQIKFAAWIGNYNYLPFHGGRDRPINFDGNYYYFQHGEANEIKQYMKDT